MEDEPKKKAFIALVRIQTPPLSEKGRRDAGHFLNLVMEGELLSMPISRPMPSIGPRVHELRLSDKSGDWRVIYRIDADEVLVVEVFKKTTRQTPKGTIDLCKTRLANFYTLKPKES